MPREHRPVVFIALAALWLLIALSRAFTMIGNPARWVDVLLLLMCGLLVGVNLVRAKVAFRARSVTPTDASGDAPNQPQ